MVCIGHGVDVSGGRLTPWYVLFNAMKHNIFTGIT